MLEGSCRRIPHRSRSSGASGAVTGGAPPGRRRARRAALTRCRWPLRRPGDRLRPRLGARIPWSPRRRRSPAGHFSRSTRRRRERRPHRVKPWFTGGSTSRCRTSTAATTSSAGRRRRGPFQVERPRCWSTSVNSTASRCSSSPATGWSFPATVACARSTAFLLCCGAMATSATRSPPISTAPICRRWRGGSLTSGSRYGRDRLFRCDRGDTPRQ